MARLASLGLAGSPLLDPLSYPGTRAPTGGLLVGERWLPIPADRPEVLDRELSTLGVAPVGERTALLAVGSNASPGQMREKLARARVSAVLPMLSAAVDGWRRVVAAHVSRPGYIPLSAAPAPGDLGLPVTVLLCDDRQVAAVDATEPNYDRTSIGAAALRLDGGREVPGAGIYVVRHGAVADPAGRPVPWLAEPAAIATAVAAAPAIAGRCGHAPADFVARCRADAAVRAWVRAEFARAGRVVALDAD